MSSDKKEEPTYSILPHPAKDNEPPSEGGGLNWGKFSGAAGVFQTPGPQAISEDQAKDLGAPLSREELQAKAKELNKDGK